MATFLPAFLIGLLMGIALRWIYDEHRKETPSETRLHILEAEVIRLKSDNETLQALNDQLQEKLAQRKKAPAKKKESK